MKKICEKKVAQQFSTLILIVNVSWAQITILE